MSWDDELWKEAARSHVSAAPRKPPGTGTIIPFREAQPIAALLPGDEDLGLGEWDAGEVTVLPPPREWLLGNIFARGFMSSLLARRGREDRHAVGTVDIACPWARAHG